MLLSKGDLEGARARAEAALLVDVQEGKPYAMGLAHLALARMYTLQSQANGSSDFTDAFAHMRLARAELRLAGHEEIEVRGLLASAELSRLSGDLDGAESTLNEARDAANRGQMRLLQSDILLQYAHLYLARSRNDQAREILIEVRHQIKSMGYYRRTPEVEALETILLG